MLADTIGDKPAPGRLKIVQSFVNTANPKAGRENLVDPDKLRAWLAGNGLLEGKPRLSNADLRQAIAVRDAIYQLLSDEATDVSKRDAVETLNRGARSAQLSVSFDPAGTARVEPLAPAVDGALGKLIAIVFEAMSDGTWQHLKICRGFDCAWAFYDRSKNHSGAWCDINDCGNVAKARAFRQRHRHTQ